MRPLNQLQQTIVNNLIHKVTYLPLRLEGTEVIETLDYVRIDCGLPADTFNIIVFRGEESTLSQEITTEIEAFLEKKFPMAVWCWDHLNHELDQELQEAGLQEAEINIAMVANLESSSPLLRLPEGLQIKEAVTSDEIKQFGEVLSSLFGTSEEADHVRSFYSKVAALPFEEDLLSNLYIAEYQGDVVTVGSLVFAEDSVGFYDIATKEEYRGKGFGTAMFHYLLQEAQQRECKLGVLQASSDGLHIYAKAGFQPVGQFKVFENRHLLEINTP
ncbi:hypothetical protein BVG16_11605 [Paenibacillus selenitireducens]|uniref:N-acetyltransferase domain-containing protein n=2 Tax=Paenibacillus selenitireducens TaxID=1324314 RepID=A0A1T2XFW2_9BACL|nr:hypothetical protein BVG16_11605 [Paenibacillus selenitireducens]